MFSARPVAIASLTGKRLAKSITVSSSSLNTPLRWGVGYQTRRSTLTHRQICQIAPLSTTSVRRAKNQVFSPIRNADSFQTYLLHSSSARTPLITLWTASYCPTCRTVEPLIQSLVESGVGEAEGGVCFAPVEFDSADIMGGGSESIAMTYMITAIPTLLSFDAGEAQTSTKITDGRKLADREFLAEWIRNEARRHGGRGGGTSGGFSFGGLFGGQK